MEEGIDIGFLYKKCSNAVLCSTVGDEGSDISSLDQLCSVAVLCSTVGVRGVILVL